MWADGEATRVGRTAAQLEADLLLAIDRNEIEVLFQPQFALYWRGGPDGEEADEALTGAEALARWKHPKLGRIGAGPCSPLPSGPIIWFPSRVTLPSGH
jgi:sensor c-di-GMP phosphodiesterase-like protein